MRHSGGVKDGSFDFVPKGHIQVSTFGAPLERTIVNPVRSSKWSGQN
jgi:hypothetical protein